MSARATTRMSTKGQLVLPKAIRERRGWSAGVEFDIEERPEGVLLRPAAKQTPSRMEDVFGSLGRISTKYGGAVTLLGKDKEYIAGKTSDIYQAGVVTNIATFHQMITAGDFANPTVEPGVQSNIITIMGRPIATSCSSV